MEYQIIVKVSKSLQKNNSEKVTNENDKKIPKQKNIDLPKKDRNY